MIENVANRIAQLADGLVVDVTFDLICPWCFVAKRRLEKASSILGKHSRSVASIPAQR